ncbi:MAG: S8 family serine peptidase [bacterium]
MKPNRTARAAARHAVICLAAFCAAIAGGAPSGAAADRGERAAYWVFLEARPDSPSKTLLLTELGERLSVRALERRARRGEIEGIRDSDLPVAAAARSRVLATGARPRVESRWLNAVSVDATLEQIAQIAGMPDVITVRRVSSRTARLPAPGAAPHAIDRAGGARGPIPAPAPPRPLDLAQLDYGASRPQLEQIGVTKLHESGLSGAGVMIGVLDTGFDIAHPALLSAEIVGQRDFVNGDDNTADEEAESSWWHGTYVLSLIAGFDPGNLIGAAHGASFVVAKTEDVANETQVEEDYWVAGLEWAESLGVDVVTSSLGYNDWYAYEQMDGETAVTTRAARMAVERGVVVVNAMGNEQGTAWRHMLAPADAEEVISVGAVNSNGALASFSSLGPTADGRTKPDVVALGVGNFGARAGGGYLANTGTSFATPLVAGVAALILEAHPTYTPAQVQLALRETAAQCRTPDTNLGWGLVRANVAATHPNPGGGCSSVPIDTTDVEPPSQVSPITRPGGDVFAPAHGPLDWSYTLASAGTLQCRLFDASGRMLAVILDGEFAAGEIAIAWDGRFDAGGSAPSGVYFLRAESAARVDTERLVLVR